MSLATYTLSQVRGKVRTRLDDNTFDATVIDEAINNYLNDFLSAHDFVFMEKTANPNLTLAPNAYTIPEPSDYFKLRSMRIVLPVNYQVDMTKKFLKYGDFNQQYRYPAGSPTSPPEAWTEYSQQFIFNSPADTTYTFVLDYMKTPSVLVNDADVLPIPNEFIECVVDGATYRIQKRDDDFDIATKEVQFLTPREVHFIMRYGSGRSQGSPRRMSGGLRTRRGW